MRKKPGYRSGHPHQHYHVVRQHAACKTPFTCYTEPWYRYIVVGPGISLGSNNVLTLIAAGELYVYERKTSYRSDTLMWQTKERAPDSRSVVESHSSLKVPTPRGVATLKCYYGRGAGPNKLNRRIYWVKSEPRGVQPSVAKSAGPALAAALLPVGAPTGNRSSSPRAGAADTLVESKSRSRSRSRNSGGANSTDHSKSAPRTGRKQLDWVLRRHALVVVHYWDPDEATEATARFHDPQSRSQAATDANAAAAECVSAPGIPRHIAEARLGAPHASASGFRHADLDPAGSRNSDQSIRKGQGFAAPGSVFDMCGAS